MEGTIKIENERNANCFVPHCPSKKTVNGNPIHFFRVPEGNEGLRWKVAVNSIRLQYERRIGILGRTIPQCTLYCCELHFNIETDAIVTIDANGTVECNIKPGIFPSIRPTRSKRMWEILRHEDLGDDNSEQFPKMDRVNTGNDLLQPLYTENVEQFTKMDRVNTGNDLLQPLYTENEEHDKDCISIIDMSTWICSNFDVNILPFNQDLVDDDQIDIKFKPMMSLTIDLMKRKSLFYMGLEQNHFFRLLHIIKSTTSVPTDSLVEMKLMLSLRKQRLNEQFEVLGDLFDIDQATAQEYYAESKNVVSSLYQSMASPSVNPELDDVKNPLYIEDHHTSDDDHSSSDAGIVKYKGDVQSDSDVVSDDLRDESTDDSESSSELNSDQLNDNNKCVKDREKCSVCGLHVFYIDNHMDTVHLNPQYLNKTVCGLCFEKFRTHRLLRCHQIQMHNGAACKCDVCEKSFTKLSGVKVHILRSHSKCKPFLCDLCGKSYFYLSKLKIHTKKAHLQIRSFSCDLCDKKYYIGPELEAHIRATHTKERPHQCRFGCGKAFSRSGNRYIHEQMHKSNFSCEICSKVFSFRHNLRTHCKNIHGINVIDTEKCKIEIQQ